MPADNETQNGQTQTTPTEITSPEETPLDTAQGETEGEGSLETSDSGGDEEGAYEIEGRKFKTQAEAFDYARQLVAEKDKDLAVADAYRQAAQDFAGRVPGPQNVTPEPEEAPLFTEEEFYSDPQATLKKVVERTKAEVTQSLSRAQQIAQEDAQTWNAFVNLHPDLDGFRTDVEAVAQEHASVVTALVKSRGQKAAMDYVAQKARAKFETYWERRKPKTELSRTKTAQPPANQQSVTPQKTMGEPVAFRDQFRKLKAQRLGN